MRDAIKALADEYERKAQKLESAWAFNQITPNAKDEANA